MRDIKAMLPEEIAAALAEMGQPKYRAKQIFQWLARGASSFDEMTNLSKDLRAALAEQFYISSLEMLRKQVSAIDGTIKYLWQLDDGNAVLSPRRCSTRCFTPSENLDARSRISSSWASASRLITLIT